MPLIEGFHVQNYRSLRDITLGRLPRGQEGDPLTPLTVVIGKNGAGKSTLFDAFGFLSDSLTVGVEAACDREQRGGFERLRSLGIQDPIRFEIIIARFVPHCCVHTRRHACGCWMNTCRTQ